MKKFILVGACLVALAAPSAAQSIDPATIINVVRSIYDATRGTYNNNNGYNNNGYYNNGYNNNGYNNNGYNNNGYNNNGYNNGYNNNGWNNGYNGNTQTNYSLNSPLDVIFTNLSQGSTVPSNFTLSGYTSPYNQVDLTVNPRSNGQSYRNSVSADSSGRFSVNVDASQVPYNSQLAIQAQARDSQGNVGPTRMLDVIRR